MFGSGFGISFTFDFNNDDEQPPVRRAPAAPAKAPSASSDDGFETDSDHECPVHGRRQGFFHSADVYEDANGRRWRRRVSTMAMLPKPPKKPKGKGAAPKTQPVEIKGAPAMLPEPGGEKTPELSRSPEMKSGSSTPKLEPGRTSPDQKEKPKT